ncbi:hypothetical protein D3C78_1006340 [compost metagenome]
MASFRQAYHHKQRIAKGLLRRRGIHGIGVGYRDPAAPSKGAAVIVYAEKATASISGKPVKRRTQRQGHSVSSHTIHQYSKKYSSTKSTIPIRIVRSSRFNKNSLPSHEVTTFRRRIRPVIAGYSVGTIDSSGTAGLIVSDQCNPRSRYLLSNNHVLVNNNSAVPFETLQPGGADGGISRRDRIGFVNRFVKLSKKRSNYIDAATSKPLRRSLLKPRYAVFGIVPGFVKTYKVGDRFKKVGRTTGVVSGIVESIHTDINVNYGEYGGLGTIQFKDQSVIRGKCPVSLSGDSGSVWLTRRGNYAAAVNFAGSDGGHLSIAYPIDWFMKVFQSRVARPCPGALKHPNRNKTNFYMYVRPLSPQAIKYAKSCTCRIKRKTKKRK